MKPPVIPFLPAGGLFHDADDWMHVCARLLVSVVSLCKRERERVGESVRCVTHKPYALVSLASRTRRARMHAITQQWAGRGLRARTKDMWVPAAAGMDVAPSSSTGLPWKSICAVVSGMNCVLSLAVCHPTKD